MLFEFGLSFNSALEPAIFFLLAALSGLWAYRSLAKGIPVSLVPVIALNLLMLLAWAASPRVYHDEAVHLHLGWLVSQGLVPFRDFWYHHSPFLWWLLSFPLKKFTPPGEVFAFARIFAGTIFLLNILIGWKIARKVWGKDARLSVYLLALSSVLLSAQFLLLRPDIFMTFFLLAGIYISLEIPGKKSSASFFAGVAFSLAASFLAKQYLLIFLPVIAVFLGERRGRARKLFCYGFGLLAGGLPLWSYLAANRISGEFISWVFAFNKQIVTFLIFFPWPIFGLGAWGGYLLFLRFRALRESKVLILLLGLVLSTLSSLTSTTYANGGYYLAFWFFMAAIAAGGCPLAGLYDRISSPAKRALAVGLFFSFLLTQNFSLLAYSWNKEFSRDREIVAQLRKYCAGDTCFVVTPLHPVFARDATRFYTYSQYLFTDDFPAFQQDLKRYEIASQVIARRPAVITCMYKNRDFMVDLYEKGLISAEDFKKLLPFLRENYAQRQVGGETFYIRNDKL